MKNKITVCVDGKNLLKPMSGISRYLNETLNTLVSEEIKVKLICPNKPLKEYHFKDDIDIIIDNAPMPLGVLQWHGQRLGKIVNSFGCDIFWGPAHRIPFGLNNSVKTVVSCHDLVCIKYSQTMRFKSYISDRIQLPLSMHRADAIHAVSQTTLADIKNSFPKLSSKIFSTLPQHTNTKAKDSFVHSNKNEWGEYALFVGTFEPRKNLDHLIKAFRLLCDRNSKTVRLVLVGGEGWGGVNIHDMITSQSLRENIKVIIRPNDEGLQKVYANCRFLILPSLYEGLGLPVIEAKTHGKPSIVSDGSLAEIADKGSIIVDPNNIIDIATAMEKLFFDDAIYQQHLERAINTPASFQWQSNTEKLVEHFFKLTM